MQESDVLLAVSAISASIYVFLDAHLILRWDYILSLQLCTEFVISYLLSIYVTRRLLRWQVLDQLISRSCQNGISDWIKATIVGIAPAVVTWVVLIWNTNIAAQFPSSAEWGPHGLHLLFLAGVTFWSTAILSLLKLEAVDRRLGEYARKLHSIIVEAWKTATWAMFFIAIGTAYAQVLGSQQSGVAMEMVVFGYGLIHTLIFAWVPLSYIMIRYAPEVGA